jgi:CspA family cold shock protein
LPVALPGPAPVPAADRRTEGRVRSYSGLKGYGFVTADNGTDCLVHNHFIERGPLVEGGRVEFDIVDGQAGPMAMRVVLLAGPPAHRTHGTVALAIAQGHGGGIINDDDGNGFLLYNGNEITQGPLPFVDGARVVFGVVPGTDDVVNIVVIAGPADNRARRHRATPPGARQVPAATSASAYASTGPDGIPPFVLIGNSTYERHELTDRR